MPVQLKDIPTIEELFKSSGLHGTADKTRLKYPPSASYLGRVSLHHGDITKLEVDSIVNAANRFLGGGGGVDGAIHAAAGAEALQAECRKLGGCATGQAKITKGYNLPSKHVIHAVGPDCRSSTDAPRKETLLASCYRSSLDLAVKNDCKQIAFPCISTQIYRYPIEEATHIALNETRKFLDTVDGDKLDRVIFVVFRREDKEVYEVDTVIFPSLRD
ncbi:A1pp-domain-containing protein [Leucogyrophana mollusca]|uniref:A1pp-domain-containing protein n=1 Tax=Leucogyrophana mollusca TaxID=85980 RepID=A0ACB8BS81_9AGAM|nr:A1pp-domain-containing protein [Leucogyrophana mollusca]